MKVGAKRLAIAAAAAAVALTMAGCSSQSASPKPSGTLSGTIMIPVVHELTGAAGFAGVASKNGLDLAVDELNSSHYLGSGVTIKLDYEDSASVTDTSVSDTSAALSSNSPLVIGPLVSTAAQAVSPLAAKFKKAMVYTQALGPGIAVNDYVYRLTPDVESYESLVYSYAKEQKVKSVAVLYASDSTRQTYDGTTMTKDFTSKNNIKILSADGFPATVTDLTAVSSKIAQEKPDAVIFFMSGTQHVTAVQQLRRAGYEGIFLADQGLSSGLAQAGTAADGAVWAAAFSPQSTAPSSVAFVKAYTAKYDASPAVYAADSYDAMYFIARALKAAGSTDKTAVQAALQAEVKKSFEGAQGTITFKGNDAQGSGVLSQYKDGKVTIIKQG